ncbi:hypothetical protein [Fortiea contorta]|uniref:hypothetical protein n=1 Tax=Fortiea contorta TaxID=1892405 RepID=UPI0003473693|nr:hypothetical protein [Fortiea contorta]
MDKLESKILEILKRGTPLRAAKIADMLGVERREVNHYLYSSLKQQVVQDTDYKWSLKSNQIGNNQRIPTQPAKPQTQSQTPTRQNTSYSFTKKEIQQDNPVKPPIIPTPSPQPVKQSNPYEIVKRELTQVSSEEKVKILENAFRQDKFSQLEDEQINALQSILEEARREVNITNTAYKQGKLSFWQNKSVAIALVTAALTLGTITVIGQLRSHSVYQPTPTLPQSR